MSVVKCDFCGRTVDGVEAAVDAGWEPSYWLDATTETGDPVCPNCQGKYLDRDGNDLGIVKAGMTPPRLNRRDRGRAGPTDAVPAAESAPEVRGCGAE